MAGQARMSDVAKLAGVSIMTVSRVLNQNPHVKQEMREKVFAAIEQLRYQPNELARSLREQRSRQIGIILPYLLDPFFALCAHSISTVAKSHSYSVVLSTSNENPQIEFDEASRMLRRNVEGLIVIPSHTRNSGSLLLAHEFNQLPIVTLDRPIEGSRFDSILVENERGALIGTERLLTLGHKRIACIGLSTSLYTMEMRSRGYSVAMKAAGLVPQVMQVSGTLQDTLAALDKLLSTTEPPTAFFCANNLITRQVLHGLQSMGIYPPEKFALIGFDDFDTADLLRPGITVVRQPIELLGTTAAEVLFARLAGTHPSKFGKEKVLPVELVVRGSCGGAFVRQGYPCRTEQTMSAASALPLLT